MAYYTKNTDRMDIYIEESRKTILIKQKWRYSWLNASNTLRWTYVEKRKFHNEVDNIIWNSWGDHFFLKVTGASDFALRNKSKRWDVNFDIEWVTHTEHWRVNVTKFPKNHRAVTSSVSWNRREITLDTMDTSYRKRSREGRNYHQYPVAHEFGHAAGNSVFASDNMHGDEYKSSSPYFKDKNSIMNIGSELRDRHLDFVISELNTMVPSSRFSRH